MTRKNKRQDNYNARKRRLKLQRTTVRPDKEGALRPKDAVLASVTSIGPICLYCQRFYGMARPGLTCAAYPDGIPDAIWSNEADHRRPYAGDRGLQFAPSTHEDVTAAEETLQMAHRGGPLPTA